MPPSAKRIINKGVACMQLGIRFESCEGVEEFKNEGVKCSTLCATERLRAAGSLYQQHRG